MLNPLAFVIPSEARDLQVAANSRSFASLRMTIREWCYLFFSVLGVLRVLCG